MSYTYDTQKHKIVGMDIKLFVNMMINIKKRVKIYRGEMHKNLQRQFLNNKTFAQKIMKKTQNIGILMSEEDKILYGKTIFALYT